MLNISNSIIFIIVKPKLIYFYQLSIEKIYFVFLKFLMNQLLRWNWAHDLPEHFGNFFVLWNPVGGLLRLQVRCAIALEIFYRGLFPNSQWLIALINIILIIIRVAVSFPLVTFRFQILHCILRQILSMGPLPSAPIFHIVDRVSGCRPIVPVLLIRLFIIDAM